MVYYLMKDPNERIGVFMEALSRVESRVHRCPICNNFAEEKLCVICTDARRDGQTICIVAEPRDLEVMEATASFRGLYHVLGGLLSPLDGVGPNELTIERLVDRVEESKPKEVVLALSSTVEGEATSSYLINILKTRNVQITRLARGVPAGGSLEYLDQRTLSQAVIGREKI